jgi:hypothetical protein
MVVVEDSRISLHKCWDEICDEDCDNSKHVYIEREEIYEKFIHSI